MTTKEDLIDGYRLVIREAKRITAPFGEPDWALPAQGNEGWNRKQAYGHIAATAEIAPGFIGNLAQGSADQNPMDGFDIDSFNDQMIAAKQQLSGKELVEDLVASYEKLIEFTQGLPQEQLDAPRQFGLLQGGTLSDVMDSVLVMHAVAHIYSAGGNAA